MTEDSTIQQQQLNELLQFLDVEEGRLTWKDVFLPFLLVWEITIDDWKHYSLAERIIFLGILSPLLWFLSAF